MALTKFESYYAKISEQVNAIKTENDYPNMSIAFAHWYFSEYMKYEDQQISEAIVDGGDDLGIDAIVVDEEAESLSLFQFKFPNSKDTIGKEIDQSAILKTWNGFETLVNNGVSYTGKNTRFLEFKTQLSETLITQFKIYFVGYNNGIVANEAIIEAKAEEYRKNTGSSVEIICHEKNVIANIYERMSRGNSICINLKYKQMYASYNVDDRKINSYVGFVKATDLVDAISPYIATIFDENIRLYEYGSKVNEGINRTATSSDQEDMFYFYNNGVVFICGKGSNSPSSNIIVMDGASVVNGCQTLTVLYNAKQKGKLRDKVCLPVRIIEISDYSERMRITEYLNSQTQIKASYFISNHPIVRELQGKLIEKGYFLERQINENRYKKEMGVAVGDLDVIRLESTIQCYVGYWDNKNASTAKREKTAIFDKLKIEDILSSISAERVIEALTTYRHILKVLTLYRKVRRNPQKTDFSEFIGASQEWLLNNIDTFRFMNTGDIILLNCVANLRQKYEKIGIMTVPENELIKESIYLIRDLAENEDNLMAALTKNAAFFSKIQKTVASLTERYQIVRN